MFQAFYHKSKSLLILRWAAILFFIGKGVHLLFPEKAIPHLYPILSDYFDVGMLSLLYFAFAIVAYSLDVKNKLISWFFLVSIGSNAFLFVGETWLADKTILHLFEKGCQWLAPLALYGLLFYWKSHKVIWLVRIAVATTFIGHGLLALGVVETPKSFYNSIELILGLDKSSAQLLLAIMGVLDVLYVIGLFVKKTPKFVFIYGVVWGFFTTFSYFLKALHENELSDTLLISFSVFILKAPNFLLPAYLLLVKNIEGKTAIKR